MHHPRETWGHFNRDSNQELFMAGEISFMGTLGDILPKISNGFILYTGAGISIPPPTCAPSWWTLTEEILTAFFDKIPDDWGMPKDLIIHDPDIQPELIFENFANIFDERLYKIFKVLNVGEPNANHQLIAKLAKAGILKACFTTNFDVYLERSLASEKVGFDIVVTNDEYDEYFSKLEENGAPPRFLLCKIHGTIDRPDTIVSVASAYKSAKGFSPPKSQVLRYLLERYPVVFLGYSGLDFEHANYRHFWETTGPKVQAIYWNRRPGEEGGPRFAEIFESCKDRFAFVEDELPGGLLSASQAIPGLEHQLLNVMLPDQGSEKIWDKVKAERLRFMTKWALEIPEGETLAAVITEGNHFSQRFKDSQKQLIKFARTLIGDIGPEEEASFKQQKDELLNKVNALEISSEEYVVAIDKVNVEYQLAHLIPEARDQFKTILDENRYPGITDDPNKRLQFLSKLVSVAERYDVDKAAEIVAELMNRDAEAMQHDMTTAEAEMTVNAVYQALVREDDDWKPNYDNAVALKESYLAGETTRADFMAGIQKILEKGKMNQFGMTIPTEKLLQMLIQSVANAPDLDDFTERVEALYLAVQLGVGWVASFIFKTPEYTALQTAATNPAFLTPPKPVDMTAIQAEMSDLVTQLSSGKISNDEYQEKMAVITKKMQSAYAAPATTTGPIVVSQEIMTAFDNKIREFFGPAFQKEQEFTSGDISEAEIMLEMLVFTCWITMARFLEAEAGNKYQDQNRQGMYPRITGNASIVEFLSGKSRAWIDKALETLPKRFAQRLCGLLVQFSEMANDFELCNQATTRSLEYSEGRVIEITPVEIPISLAQSYENAGDKDSALQYYKIALQGLRSAIPSYYGDVVTYRTAMLVAEQGNKEEALRIIDKYHIAFHGSNYPVELPARRLGLEFANSIAKDLGYPDAKTAIDAIIK